MLKGFLPAAGLRLNSRSRGLAAGCPLRPQQRTLPLRPAHYNSLSATGGDAGGPDCRRRLVVQRLAQRLLHNRRHLASKIETRPTGRGPPSTLCFIKPSHRESQINLATLHPGYRATHSLERVANPDPSQRVIPEEGAYPVRRAFSVVAIVSGILDHPFRG